MTTAGSRRCRRAGRLAAALLALALLPGCAMLRDFQPSVEVRPMNAGEYIAMKRGDILTSGALSTATVQTISVAGLEQDGCAQPSMDCIAALGEATGIGDEHRISALTELWLQHAIALSSGRAPAPPQARVDAWLEVARHAYAYLFFTPRTPGDRAFEDRQTQVIDYYNHAVQEATTRLFQHWQAVDQATAIDDILREAGWTLHSDLSGVRLPGGAAMPDEVVPASALFFGGLRSTYRRDGFGAELVAVVEDGRGAAAPAPEDEAPDAERRTEETGADAGEAPRRRPPGFSEMPSPAMTVLAHFPGDDLRQVLATREVELNVHDPYQEATVELHGQTVPLAANFTAGYGLWLARSGFSRQALQTLLGREQGIDRPHLYLMQPYDPDRRIILMLHGLASSPEAWVNVANEILGDETLRREFQVWQVYYPTNMPIVLNHAAIRRALAETLRTFDPEGTAAASNDIVLIGHSMGGVLTRLLVSSADEELWDWLLHERELDEDREALVRTRLDPMMRFEPFPGVSRTIFIAAPHRGTHVATNRLARWLARLIRLPLTLLEGLDDAVQALAGSGDEGAGPNAALPNSIDNLRMDDPFIQAAAKLPISPRVRYHSIIARSLPEVPLEESDDGLVPYWSAHLPGALSEQVIVSGHSVQETAPAILEIRRILHEDLAATEPGPGPEPVPATPGDADVADVPVASP